MTIRLVLRYGPQLLKAVEKRLRLRAHRPILTVQLCTLDIGVLFLTMVHLLLAIGDLKALVTCRTLSTVWLTTLVGILSWNWHYGLSSW